MSSAPAAASLPRRPVLADAIPGALARDIALVVGGALFTALMAQVTIHVPGSVVPVTGQTLAVYADGESGWHVVTGASGGYIIGFILAAGAIGWLAERGADRKVLAAFLAFVVGQLLVFGVGVPWLKVSTDMAWGDAIHDGFTIFILGGLIKAAIGAAVLPSAWTLVRRVEKRDEPPPADAA
jgi:biotin transport system substrate-specific component